MRLAATTRVRLLSSGLNLVSEGGSQVADQIACAESKTGGSNGATMRFNPEKGHGANAGLHVAQDVSPCMLLINAVHAVGVSHEPCTALLSCCMSLRWACAEQLLEPIKKAFPWITYADLWTLAGAQAIEEMGGPHIDWRPGRSDQLDGAKCPPDGRLPDVGAALCTAWPIHSSRRRCQSSLHLWLPLIRTIASESNACLKSWLEGP